jgi:hypothetical protein
MRRKIYGRTLFRPILRWRRLRDEAQGASTWAWAEHIAPASVQPHEPIRVDPRMRARGVIFRRNGANRFSA